MTTTPANLHGRRATRGLRPFLLIPKVLCVAVYFGGVVAALALWLMRGRLGPASAVSSVDMILRWVCFPALLGTIAFGLLLFLQHPREFARMRWWRAKMLWLLVSVAPGAWIALHGLADLRDMGFAGGAVQDAVSEVAGALGGEGASIGFVSAKVSAGRVTLGLSLLAISAAALIILGRQKPRLGQNWALSSPRNAAGGSDSASSTTPPSNPESSRS
ncbi:MAG: hypothetical protein NTW19_06305 [Planctomycetota bacterium]|nr:hypothetical protein [Planctomycetota bacterium]